MATPPLLHLDDIVLGFGGTPLLDGAELSVGAGERLCLVGRNGSGKSTLLKIAAGQIEAESGSRFLQPGTTVRYLPQEPDLTGYGTARAYVEAGLDASDDPHRATYLLERLGLSAEADPAVLSGGEKRRAALARALAPRPEVLLLDEPTNHLDLPTIEWLEAELKSLRGALVLISHDRRFLERLAQAVVWLDRGTTQRMEAGFEKFEDWRAEILEQEASERRKLDRRIERETSWLHKGVTARRKRNMGRLRALDDLRKQRRQRRGPTGQVTLEASAAETSGKKVIEAKGLSKSFGGQIIVRDFSTRILRGDRVGLIGPNGAGKTTLLNMLTGALAPDEGTVTHGTALEMATLDQGRASLDPETVLRDALTGQAGGDRVTVAGKTKHVMTYMQDFLFAPEQARTPIARLSGGERGRLMLARALARPSTLLVLDEPTNDLDLETLDLLQELIADYPGTVLLVSHDRDFLDRTVTSVIHAEGDGRWVEYAGGYSDMVAQRGGAPAPPGESAPAKSKPARKAEKRDAGRAGGSKSGLSFTDRHRLEALPNRIAALETTIEKLQATLAAPDLYSRDPDAFQKATDALTEATKTLEAAEEEWLRLEALREASEGG